MPDWRRAGDWSAASLPDLSGRVALVTGANSGLGFETCRGLARAGAHVVLACRRAERASAARDRIAVEIPGASLECVALDLASLDAVRACAEEVSARHAALHVLCNNAGVMALPFVETTDGFEMHFGTNHLGHFALTGRLLGPLLAAERARVVNVSSMAHWIGRMDFQDPHRRRGYGKWSAYAQSKLANLLFTAALQRRFEAAGTRAAALAAHPGYAATELQATGPRMQGARLLERGMEVANRLFAQPAEAGALPSLFAAAAPDATPGGYYGPAHLFGAWGAPAPAPRSARARSEADAESLWALSVEATGVGYEALAA